MANTTNFGIPLVDNGGAGAEVVHNDAIERLANLVHLGVAQFDLNTPPGSPANGQAWKVGAAPSGAWAANADDIAVYSSGWAFASPTAGMLLWDENTSTLKICSNPGTDTWLNVPHSATTSITQLTDSTGGTANNTLQAVSGSGADAAINNNFADIAAKLNAVLVALGWG